MSYEIVRIAYYFNLIFKIIMKKVRVKELYIIPGPYRI